MKKKYFCKKKKKIVNVYYPPNVDLSRFFVVFDPQNFAKHKILEKITKI